MIDYQRARGSKQPIRTSCPSGDCNLQRCARASPLLHTLALRHSRRRVRAHSIFAAPHHKSIHSHAPKTTTRRLHDLP